MKLVIELDKVAYDLLTGKIETANIDLFSTLIKSVQNGTPLEFGNISVEAIEEESHCPACIHYVQRDIPNVFCNNCKNREELFRRMKNE